MVVQAALNRIDKLGRFATSNLEYTTRVLLTAYLSIRAAILDHSQGLRTIFGVIAAQIYFTGWQALPLISVLALAAGGITILQGSANLSLLGGSEMLGKLLVILLVRELGPLITALVVIARSGTAVASEVGNMRANREIEALESMGINPLSYIVFPRLVGGMVSVVCLAFYFNLMAIVGGFIIAKLIQDMNFWFFFDSLMNAMSIEDIYIFFLKNLFSGVIIFIVSCYQGLSVKRSPTEVPVATTQAVMNAIIFVTVFNLGVDLLFYLNELVKLGVL